jgi:hypothetical protein
MSGNVTRPSSTRPHGVINAVADKPESLLRVPSIAIRHLCKDINPVAFEILSNLR